MIKSKSQNKILVYNIIVNTTMVVAKAIRTSTRARRDP